MFEFILFDSGAFVVLDGKEYPQNGFYRAWGLYLEGKNIWVANLKVKAKNETQCFSEAMKHEQGLPCEIFVNDWV